jgi:hypothetical protein
MFSRHYPVPQPCKVRAGCCVALWRPARFADCQSGGPARRSFGAIAGPFPFLDSPSISQQEILDHKFAFATRKRTTAGAARYLTVDGFRTGFDFDDLIKRIAVRTVESRPASRHKRPHTDFLIVGAKLAFPVVHSQSESAKREIGFVLVSCQGCSLPWFGDLRTASSPDKRGCFCLPRINSLRISSPAYLGQKDFP